MARLRQPVQETGIAHLFLVSLPIGFPLIAGQVKLKFYIYFDWTINCIFNILPHKSMGFNRIEFCSEFRILGGRIGLEAFEHVKSFGTENIFIGVPNKWSAQQNSQ